MIDVDTQKELSELMQGAYDALCKLDTFVYCEIADTDRLHPDVVALGKVNDQLVKVLNRLPGDYVES